MQIIQEVKKEILNRSIRTKEKSDDFGEVFTPFHLIQDMLDLVKEEDWSNPETTFYDPCAGKGNFPILIIERLFKGLEEVIPNEEERLEHILSKQLFMTEYQESSYEETKEILSKLGVDLNFKLGNALEIFGQEFGVDSFTYTVANPPYQSAETRRRIFNKFIEHTHTFSDNQIYVIPSSWIYNTNLSTKFKSWGLNQVSYYPRDVFGIFLRFSISVIRLSKEPTENITITKGEESYQVGLKDILLDCTTDQYDFLKTVHDLPSLDIRRNKTTPPRGVRKNVTQERLGDNFSVEETERFRFKTALFAQAELRPDLYIYCHTEELNFSYPTVNFQLVGGGSGTIGKAYFVDQGIQCLDNQYYTQVEDREHGEKVVDYLQSDVVKYIVSLTKINDVMTTYRNALDFIPELQYREQIETLYRNLKESH